MAKITYIQIELDWLEKKIQEFRDLVDAHSPLSEIEDRTEVEPNAKGIPTIKVIAKKEDTIKMIKDIIMSMPNMLESLAKLREERATAEIELRGGGTLNGMMAKTRETAKT